MRIALIYLLTTFSSLSLMAQVEGSFPNNPDKMDETTESTAIETPLSSVEQLQILLRSIERKKEIVQSLYFIEEEVKGSYNSYGSISPSVVTRHVKKKIYKAGQTLLEDEEMQLAKISSAEEKIEAYNGIIDIYDQMIKFGQTEDTKQKEKALKKLKDPEEIKSVFFN